MRVTNSISLDDRLCQRTVAEVQDAGHLLLPPSGMGTKSRRSSLGKRGGFRATILSSTNPEPAS